MLRLKLTLLVLAICCVSIAARAKTIPSGTEFVVELDRTIQWDNKGGDRFSGKLAFPVFVNEREAVPVGTKIEGDVHGNKKEVFLSPKRLILPDGRKVDFNASLSAVNGQHLKEDEKEGAITEKGGNSGPAARQAGEAGAMGTILGAVTTGSIEGAGIGAGIGVAAVLIGRKIAGRNKSTTTIPAGTQLTLSLSQPLEMPETEDDSVQKPLDRTPDGLIDRAQERQDAPPVLHRQDADPVAGQPPAISQP